MKEGRLVSRMIWKLIAEEGERGWQLSYSHRAPLELCPTGPGQCGAKPQLAGLLKGLTRVSLCPENSGTSCYNPAEVTVPSPPECPMPLVMLTRAGVGAQPPW